MSKNPSLAPTGRDRGIVGQDGKCNVLKRDGSSRCQQPAGFGTDHNGYGACQFHGGNSPTMVTNAARAYARELALELDVDPYEALVSVVRMSAGTVAWVRHRISELEGEGEIDDLEQWIKMYGDERDRLARHCKIAIDAGVDERRIQLEEAQGEQVAAAIRAILDDLELTGPQLKKAPAIARKHLMAIAAGD